LKKFVVKKKNWESMRNNMIYVHHYTKNKDSFFAENNKQQSLNREIEINLAEEGTLIGWHKSYSNNIIWIACRKSKEDICIMALDNNGDKIAYINLKDEFIDSELSFKNMTDENKVIVSLTAEQDGSRDFCITLADNEFISIHKFSRNLTYVFDINNDYALFVDFYTGVFYKISNKDFQIKTKEAYTIFENDALSNVWRINDSFGIFSTTEERWYVFELNALKLVDELVIESYADTDNGGYYGINTLENTGDELKFRCYNYKNGKDTVDMLGVDKTYLDKLIREKIKNK